MTVKIKQQLALFALPLFFLTFSNVTDAQGLINRLKKKAEGAVEDALNKKIDKTTDDVLNGKTKKFSGNGHTGSDIKETDFFQIKNISNLDVNNSRLKIANNLLLDIKGKYPIGYEPKWRFISYNSPLNFSLENWVAPSSVLQSAQKNISIGDYQGKAILRFGAFITCDCFADIVINDSSALLVDKPQTFKLTNFRKILNDRSTGEPCIGIGHNPFTDGGWEGKITLSANYNGDLTMDLMIENYRVGLPSTVSYRYVAKGITIENEMSAQKAIAIIEAEKEAKQKQKDYIAKTTKQADSLQKIIAKKYPGPGCKDCFVRNSNSSLNLTPTTTIVTNGLGDVVGTQSGTDWDVNTKTTIKNKCNYPLTFIGIQQLYDEERGYYLKEVVKTMEADYNYSADQGIVSSLFTSLVGGGSEFNFSVQDKYAVNYASVNSVQWLKVIKSN